MKTNRFLSLTAMLCISLFFSCADDIEPPPPPNYSSSADNTSSSVYISSSSSSLPVVKVSSSSEAIVLSSSSVIPSSSSVVPIVPSSSSIALPSSSSVQPSSSSSSVSGTSGIFTDSRDSKVYKWVKIGTQIWIAENLNYNVDGSACYNNQDSYCTQYGRLYNWAIAVTACPSGWHLPSYAEWTTLTDFVGGFLTAGTKLKAMRGWNQYSGIPAGSDIYGFAALPGGSGSGSGFGGLGEYGDWWSTSEYNASDAYYLCMHYDYERTDLYNEGKSDLRSVRCLQD